MVNSRLSTIYIAVACVIAYANAWSLSQNMTGNNFFDNFNFFTDNDPTHGYVNYLSAADAWAQGLLYAEGDKIIIGSDNQNIASGRGRNSVRIQSKSTWNYGLFVLDLVNMPAGCGTWPSWWFVGPNWPNQGEIDVLEGVNTMTSDQTTLHTSDGCSMSSEGSPFTGTWATGPNGNPTTDCYINAPGQYAGQGCGIIGKGGSFGTPFNQNGGGAFAVEWTADYIRTFFWQRGTYPGDLFSESPNPANWGTPYAYFALGTQCPNSHFSQQTMIFDLTFCGDWAGGLFGTMCPNMGDCAAYVQNNPHAFDSAYWWIQQLLVFQ